MGVHNHMPETAKPDEPMAAPKNAAVRSYLNATITPALLKGLMELEKEDPQRPVVWLAEWLENYAENN